MHVIMGDCAWLIFTDVVVMLDTIKQWIIGADAEVISDQCTFFFFFFYVNSFIAVMKIVQFYSAVESRDILK